MKIQQIRKRDGSWELFQPQKITTAIEAALQATRPKDTGKAKKLADTVTQHLEKTFTDLAPSVEDVQDVVEEILLKHKLNDTAKAFTNYRLNNKVKEFRTFQGVRDDLGLTPNAITILAQRYLLRNDQAAIVETPSRLFRRVAKTIAHIDRNYDPKANTQKLEETFYQLLANLEFLPNTPTLMNAGTPLGQLSACFVLPIGDSLPEIFDSVKHMALIHQSGGGTGFSFSTLRPKNSIVHSTKGGASGPVSFMRVFDITTDVVKQGGKRRGANMGVLRVDHPDILEFISAKTKEGNLTNFNLSVAITDTFMKALDKNLDYPLINPHTKQAIAHVKAKDIFDHITLHAWKSGDPGIVFLDEINRTNPTAHLGHIESTNPCGEQPLHPYESCNLGSINVAKFVKNGKPEWERLTTTIKHAVHFLDNVIDANKYPLPQIELMTKSNRRIGLGIMGFAEMLIRLGIPYNSPKALEFAEKLMKFINDEARKVSTELASKRGSFPNYSISSWAKDKRTPKGTRNATVTTIAPTGTISIIANATSGIEPLFAVTFVRKVLDEAHLLEVNPVFETIAKERGFYSKALMLKIAKKGSVQGMKEVPKDIQKLFVTALDITPEWHVKMQAAFQTHCDNAVSKTVNLPENATVDDVRKTYLLAYKLKCKGITVYRYGSKKDQVLTIGKPKEEKIAATTEFSGGCPNECSY